MSAAEARRDDEASQPQRARDKNDSEPRRLHVIDPDDPPLDVIGPEPEGEGKDGSAPVWGWLKGWFDSSVQYWTLPDFLNEPRPSWKARADYAQRGGNVPGVGVQRTAMMAWGKVSGVVGVLTALVDWIFDRFGRFALANLLVGSLALWPIGRALLALLLLPFHWGYLLLTE